MKAKKIILIISILITVLLLGGYVYGMSIGLFPNFIKEKTKDTVKTQVTTEPVIESTTEPTIVEPEKYAVGDQIRAVWLVAGVDFYKNAEADEENIKKEIDSTVAYIKGQNYINTIILPLDSNDKILYDCSFDLLSYIKTKAKESNLAVIAEVDLYRNSNALGEDKYIKIGEDSKTQITEKFAKFADVGFDGVILSKMMENTAEQAETKEEESTETTTSDGSTVKAGEKAEKETNENLLSDITAAKRVLRAKSPELYFTAKISSDEYTYKNKNITGSCLEVVSDGIFNGLFIDVFETDNDSEYSFKNIADRWAELLKAEEKTKEYVINHAVFKTGGKWDNPDQIISQLITLTTAKPKGSAFYSISDLKKNDNKIGTLLSTYYAGKIDPEYISNELNITNHKTTTIDTTDTKVSFMGGSDPNFPLLVNQKEIERSKNGNFSLTYDLKPGANKFEFENKGKKLDYTVNSSMIIIKSVAPSGEVTVDGDTMLYITAIAQNGANVTASLSGSTISLEKGTTQNNEDSSIQNTNFINYYGVVKMPSAKSSVQDLGQLIFMATYNGYSDSKAGAVVKVAKIYEDEIIDLPPETIPATTQPQVTTRSPSQGGQTAQTTTQAPAQSSGIGKRRGTVAEVTANSAKTFNGSVLDDWARPDYSPYPKGTVDFAVGNVQTYQDLTYRKLNSGRRVYNKDIKTYTGDLYSENPITVASSGGDYSYTRIVLNTLWKAPFDIYLRPQSYASPYPQSGSMPDYTISSPTFNYVDIEFKYCKSISGQINFPANSPFKSYEYVKNSSGEYNLRLYLKTTGTYNGYTAEYNASNQLVLNFRNTKTAGTASNKYGSILKGITIMLDAGHGGNDTGAPGSIQNYQEKDVNLSLAKLIKTELESIGATVIMTRSTDSTISLDARVDYMLANKPDMYISVHHNSSSNQDAFGFESYYYTPNSYKLSSNIYSNVLSSWKQIYNTSDTSRASKCGRGSKYYPFHVTRVNVCPAILVEYGFMSNVQEYELFIKPSNQQIIAEGTVKGIVSYIRNR